jgi:hypothetical protein
LLMNEFHKLDCRKGVPIQNHSLGQKVIPNFYECMEYIFIIEEMKLFFRE